MKAFFDINFDLIVQEKLEIGIYLFIVTIFVQCGKHLNNYTITLGLGSCERSFLFENIRIRYSIILVKGYTLPMLNVMRVLCRNFPE